MVSFSVHYILPCIFLFFHSGNLAPSVEGTLTIDRKEKGVRGIKAEDALDALGTVEPQKEGGGVDSVESDNGSASIYPDGDDEDEEYEYYDEEEENPFAQQMLHYIESRLEGQPYRWEISLPFFCKIQMHKHELQDIFCIVSPLF